jgi:hypothetical protein
MIQKLREKREKKRTRAMHAQDLARSSQDLSPLTHSPGGYLDPVGHPTPPFNPWGVPFPSPLALALAEPETAHLELHPSSLSL